MGADEIYRERKEYLQSKEFLEQVELQSICDDIIEYIELWMDEEDLTLRLLAEKLDMDYRDTFQLFSGNTELILKSLGKIYLAMGKRFLYTPLTIPKQTRE